MCGRLCAATDKHLPDPSSAMASASLKLALCTVLACGFVARRPTSLCGRRAASSPPTRAARASPARASPTRASPTRASARSAVAADSAGRRATSSQTRASPRGAAESAARPALWFPGGGLYFWWQLGAVKELRRRNVDAEAVVGASAGALAAVLYKCDVDASLARDRALELSVPLLDRGAWGLVGRWGPVVAARVNLL